MRRRQRPLASCSPEAATDQYTMQTGLQYRSSCEKQELLATSVRHWVHIPVADPLKPVFEPENFSGNVRYLELRP